MKLSATNQDNDVAQTFINIYDLFLFIYTVNK